MAFVPPSSSWVNHPVPSDIFQQLLHFERIMSVVLLQHDVAVQSSSIGFIVLFFICYHNTMQSLSWISIDIDEHYQFSNILLYINLVLKLNYSYM